MLTSFVLAKIRAWLIFRNTVRELESLNDKDLSDLGISRSDIHPTSPAGMTITAQLRMVPDGLPRAAVVPTDGLPMEDTHHYDMAGHKGWAERAIGILRGRGWARW